MKGKKIKTGGAMSSGPSLSDMKSKSGGSKKAAKVHGTSPMARLDKCARGGKIATVSSPLSGAEPSGLPGGGKAKTKPDKEND